MAFTHIILYLIPISAVIHIYFDHKKKYIPTYVFKPLTVILIIILAIFKEQYLSDTYKIFTLVGLCFSLLGDVFLMFKNRDYFTKGLAAFLIAHTAYIFAVLSEFGLTINFVVLIVVIIYFAILLRFILPKSGSKKPYLVFYSCAIGFLLFQGISLLVIGAISSMIFLGVGIIFFAISDSVLAFYSFAKKINFAQIMILSTYYIAQVLIALSV